MDNIEANTPVIQTFNLTKVYRNKVVLNNVNIRVEKGDIYGFVGRNGAGKTTLIRVLCNLVFPTSGHYEIEGKRDPKDLRIIQRRVASMVETPALYLDMTGEDNIKTRCILFGITPTPEIIRERLEEVGLEDVIGTKKIVKSYSLGMKQRLGIAMALMGDPEILFLDEPTNGLDPDGIKEVRDLILKINKERNVTVLVSSHILGELSKLATRFGFIEKGVLVEEISSEELYKKEGRSLIVQTEDTERAFDVVKTLLPEAIIDANPQQITIYHVKNSMEIIEHLYKNNVHMTDFYNIENSLEDYFIRLIGEVE